MKKRKKTFAEALISLIILSIIIFGISMYFVFNKALIGPIFLVLGVMNVAVLKLFKIKLKSISPNIVFGAIDNGTLVFLATLGGIYAGVFGAVIGGVAGNTITDSIGGLFEGKVAEKLRKERVHEERTALTTMLGKMCGCLFGAGFGLIIIWLISLI